MLLIMIFNFCVGFTDVYVAGFISPEVQAAVGYVSLLYFLVIILANAISIGTLALVSRAIGGGDDQRALEVARQSLSFGFAVAIALTLAGVGFAGEIVAAAGFPGQIRDIAETFLRIFSIALGANYLLIISNALFRASGNVHNPLLTMFVVSLVNIGGDFALVFGWGPLPRFGYAGIAFATATSVVIGMAINLWFFSRGRWRDLYRGSWSVSAGTIAKIARIGWPAALLQITWNAGTFVLYNILSRLGEASIPAMAAIANGMRIEALIFLPAFALNMSASVLVGQNLGAGKPDRAERATWRIAATGAVALGILALPIYLNADAFAALVARDAAVLAETTRYLQFNMAGQPFLAMSLVLSGALQGAGDTRGTMWIIAIAMWLIRLPLAYGLGIGLGYGAPGIWMSMLVSMTLQCGMMAARFRTGRWKQLKID